MLADFLSEHLLRSLYKTNLMEPLPLATWLPLGVVGKVGLEPTKPKAPDLQSGGIATIRLAHISSKSSDRIQGKSSWNALLCK